MSLLKPRNPGRFGPLPGRLAHDQWCVECHRPDPGVVDHYSRTWTGGSHVDCDAGWLIRVTQKVTDGRPEPALIDIYRVSGAYAHTAALIAALSEAQALADALNIGVPHREQVPA